MSRLLFLLAALVLSAPLAHAQNTVSLISDRTEFNGTWQSIGPRLMVSEGDSTEAIAAYALQLRLTVSDLGEPVLEGGEQRIVRMPANAFGMVASAQTHARFFHVSGALAPEAGQALLTVTPPSGKGRAVVFEAHMTSDSRLVLTPVDNEDATPRVYRRVDAFATR